MFQDGVNGNWPNRQTTEIEPLNYMEVFDDDKQLFECSVESRNLIGVVWGVEDKEIETVSIDTYKREGKIWVGIGEFVDWR